MTRGGTEIVSAAVSGDPAAWRELYTGTTPAGPVAEHAPTADAAASAEDIAAEAWLTAATKLSQFPGTDDEFVRWLFTIARNHASNTRRTAQRRRTDPVETLTLTMREAVTDDAMEAVDGSDTTRRLLSQLSPREAEVVACIDVVGLDVTTTARVLGMKPTAVRVARHRALGRLRATVAAAGPAVETDPTLSTTM